MLLLGLFAACTPQPTVSPGATIAARLECNRCHEAPQLTPAPSERSCVRCHQDILAGTLDEAYEPEALSSWKENIHSLIHVPDLGLASRLERSWVVRYLETPRPLRPGLHATMPRFALDPGEAEALADWMGCTDTPGTPPSGDPEVGLVVMNQRGCGSCHHYTGTELSPTPPPSKQPAAALALAPDLRHTRDRMSAAAISAWLADPQGAMPDPHLSPSERVDVTAALTRLPLSAVPEPVPVSVPKPLERQVSWSEVEDRVFKAVCWHCHSDPAGNSLADGGPGNTGGLGFAGAGLELGTREGILRGRLDAQGQRVSVLEPGPNGIPRLVAVLLARHAELSGHHDPQTPGMPMGLAPLELEQIQLVVSWIAQGSPP